MGRTRESQVGRPEGEEARAAAHGWCPAPSGNDGPYALFGPDSQLIGVFRDTGAKSCPEVVLGVARG